MQKPKLQETPEWSALEKLEHEFAAIGFYLSSHPLAGYVSALQKLGVISSAQFAQKLGETQYRAVKIAGIVTDRKFKVSDKGRFAFIQLSDMGGVFEVSVFNETLLSQNRDMLENGKILLIQAEGKMEESGPRLIAQQITLFDETIKQQRQTLAAALHIIVKEADALPEIRALLGQPAKQGAHITLSVKTEKGDAVIELPEKYTVTPAVIDKIRAILGVIAAEEVAGKSKAA